MSLSRNDLVQKYFVDDLSSAGIPGSRLHSILEVIESDRPITPLSLAFLDQKGLTALWAFASGSLAVDAFRLQAVTERDARLVAARQQADVEELARQAREAAMDAEIRAYFDAPASDPARRRRQEAKDLRTRYSLGFVDSDIYPRVMRLLRQMDIGQRLSAEDVVWLSTQGEECWTPELRIAHHRLEAMALTDDWRRTGDPWAAVTASGHWRKADDAKEAVTVTEAALAATPQAPKLCSALKTTRGGAMRDLGRLSEARGLGQEAQLLTPKDFRPCTLLGAVHMELGEFSTGQEWYEKAEKLGAKSHSIDQDLRGILARAVPDLRAKLCAYLVSQDEHRFAWVREFARRQTK